MNVLYITSVAQVGPFLQIYGHKDKNLLKCLNDNIQLYLPKLIVSAPASTPLIPNQVYLVHNPRSNKYFRCTFLEQREPDRVAVEFIDYGNEFEVSAQNVSFIHPSIHTCEYVCVSVQHVYVYITFIYSSFISFVCVNVCERRHISASLEIHSVSSMDACFEN